MSQNDIASKITEGTLLKTNSFFKLKWTKLQ